MPALFLRVTEGAQQLAVRYEAERMLKAFECEGQKGNMFDWRVTNTQSGRSCVINDHVFRANFVAANEEGTKALAKVYNVTMQMTESAVLGDGLPSGMDA